MFAIMKRLVWRRVLEEGVGGGGVLGLAVPVPMGGKEEEGRRLEGEKREGGRCERGQRGQRGQRAAVC
jgi:hypothetical protein